MGWKTSDEILDDIHGAFHRLKSGETDAETAHAEARLLGTATKLLGLQIDHAKTTDRLLENINVLPGFVLGDKAE